jgi:membrane-bound serine protease (ClpP class)
VALVVALLLAFFVLPSPWGVVAVVLAAVWEVGEAWFMIRWTQRRRAQVGAEALIGTTARVVVDCAPAGQIVVKGERWNAVCEQSAPAGAHVRIERVEGLTLVVTRLAEASDVAAAD